MSERAPATPGKAARVEPAADPSNLSSLEASAEYVPLTPADQAVGANAETRSLVLITHERKQDDNHSTKFRNRLGYVIGQRGKMSYVATFEDLHDGGLRLRPGPNTSEDVFHIYWSDGTIRDVPAQLVATHQDELWVFEAPAEMLPRPLPNLKVGTVAVNDPVWIVRYPSLHRRGAPESAEVVSATVTEINEVAQGRLQKLKVSHLPFPTLGMATLFNAQGEIVGQTFVPDTRRETAREGFTVVNLSGLAELFLEALEPALGSVDVARVGEEGPEIRYQFAARIDDPFEMIDPQSKPSLLIRTQRPNAAASQLDRNNRQLKLSPLQPATEVELSPSNPEPSIMKLLVSHGLNIRDSLELANLIPDPKDLQAGEDPRFTVQLTYKDRAGQIRYGYPSLIACAGIPSYRKPLLPPASQADITSLSLPTLTPETAGGMRLTSEATRLKLVPNEGVAAELPKPSKYFNNAATARMVTEEELGELEGKVLDMQVSMYDPQPQLGNQCNFSDDEEFVYVAGYDYTLRKLSTKDLSCQAQLPLPCKCNQIALSKSGLILVLEGMRSIWVIDPATLNLLRAIPVDRPQAVAACTGSVVGVCRTDVFPGEVDRGFDPALILIDFESGVILHLVRMSINVAGKYQYLTLPGDIHMSPFCHYLQLSRDGGLMIASGKEGLMQFRLVHHDLVFEKAARTSLPFVADTLRCTPDASEILIGSYAAGVGQRTMQLMNFKSQQLQIPQRQVSVLGSGKSRIDLSPVTSTAWIGNDSQLHRWLHRTSQTKAYPHDLGPIDSICCGPQGKYVGICAKKKFALIVEPKK